jgi:hypothetical protein
MNNTQAFCHPRPAAPASWDIQPSPAHLRVAPYKEFDSRKNSCGSSVMSWVKAVCKYEKLPPKVATRLMHDFKRTHDASESQKWQVNAEGLQLHSDRFSRHNAHFRR